MLACYFNIKNTTLEKVIKKLLLDTSADVSVSIIENNSTKEAAFILTDQLRYEGVDSGLPLLFVSESINDIATLYASKSHTAFEALFAPTDLPLLHLKLKKLLAFIPKQNKVQQEKVVPNLQNLLLENTHDVAWCINFEYQLIYSNDEFLRIEKLYKLTPTHLNDSVLNGLTPALFEFWKKSYDAVFKGKELRFDDAIEHENTIHYFENYLFPIYDEQNEEVLYVGGISRNVSERNEKIIELQSQQKQLETIIASIDDIVFEIDKDGVYKNVWTNAPENLYFEKSYFIGKKNTQILPPPIAQLFDDALLKAATENIVEITYQLAEKSNDVFLATIRKINKNIDEHVYVVTIKNITNVELQKNTAQVMIDNTDDLMWAIDKNYKLLSFNQSFAKASLHFCKVAPQTSLNMLHAYNVELNNAFEIMYKRCLDGETFYTEFMYFNNAKLHSELFYKPIYSKDNQVIGATINSKNIALRKSQEHEILNKQGQLKAIIESLDEVIIVMDELGTYLSVWTKDEYFLKTISEKYVGKTIGEIQGAVNAEDFMEQLNSCLASGQEVVYEYESRLKKGEYYSAKINIVKAETEAPGQLRKVSISSKNITELYTTKQALATVQNNTEFLINSLDECIWSMDNSYVVTAFNARFFSNLWSFFGLEIVLGEHIKTSIGEVFFQRCLPIFESCLSGQNINYNFEFPYKNTIYFFDCTLNPIKHNNQVIGIAGCIKDVTERKQIEAKIHSQEVQLNAIIQSLNDVVLEIDNSLCILNIWSANEGILPLPITQMIGISLEQEHLHFSSKYLSKNVRKAFELKQNSEHEYWERHRGWERARITYIELPSVQPTVIVALSNINELKKSENSVKKQQEQLFSVIESIQDAIVLVDTNYTIQMYNQAYYTQILEPQGYTKNNTNETLSIVKILEKSNPQEKEYYLKQVDACLKGQTIFIEREIDIAGTIKFYSIHFNPVKNQENEASGVVILIIDITEQKNKLLLEKQKSEALNTAKAKSDFLSVMSHEIKTPLNAVIGLTHILLDEAPSEPQIEPLSNIKFAANNLLNLIDDILFYNRLDSGKIEIKNIDFNLFQSLKSILAGNKSFMFNNNNKMELVYDPRLPLDVKGDEIRINQVINNLVTNASKFTQNGEIKVNVALEKQEADLYYVNFMVSDTGKGIAPDKQDKIFEFFEQENIEVTRKYGGTGIGLAIVKTILQELGSKISLVSELGKGASFSFTLQLYKSELHQADIDAKAIHESEHKLQGIRILVAEDTPSNVWVLTKMLRKSDVVLDICGDGTEAVARCASNHYDLVLMDIQMPIMDGFEATKEIRKTKPNLPIIALSASNLDELKDQIIASGMTDYISKPFHPHQFFAKLYYYANRIKAGFYDAPQ